MAEAILQQSAKDFLRSIERGQYIEDEGVFTGSMILPTCAGDTLCLVYAAPKDLSADNGRKIDFSFDEAKDEVTNLKNFFGHNGRFYDYESGVLKDICRMGEDSWRGEYREEWFIADINFLEGGFVWEGSEVCVESLYALRNTGAIKGTITLAKGVNGSTRYGSSTLEKMNYFRHTENMGFVQSAHQSFADFSDGSIGKAEYIPDNKGECERPSVAKYRLFRLKAMAVF